MAALGHDIRFVTGPHREGQTGHFLHRDFAIDIDLLNGGIASTINVLSPSSASPDISL
jgi:hypothetical protein